jgi:hypothetical protein
LIVDSANSKSVALGYIDALARMAGEAEADKTASTGPTAQTIKPPAVCRELQHRNHRRLPCELRAPPRRSGVAAVAATKGLMLTFDDFLIGMSVRPEHPAADGVPRGERPAAA